MSGGRGAAASGADVDAWRNVAAAGTAPARLAAVVARLVADGGAGSPLSRDLAAAAGSAPAAPPAEVVAAVVGTDSVPLPGAPAAAAGRPGEDRGVGADARPDPAADPRRGADEVAGSWRRLGVLAAVVGDPLYPDRLRARWPDADVPPLLAWRGPPPVVVDRGPTVAIVGARRATPYGTGIASWLAEAASSAGILVVSGGAVGIDAAAHDAARDGPGGTVVVLGCGHAVRYPRPHARSGGLFASVLSSGGALVSEHLPTTRPRAGVVRARNRIVAALADVVVVVEGGARSGALVTASAAAQRGVPVLAVPGDVRRPGSAAPHRLLAEGAAPCTGPEDLLNAVGVEAALRTQAGMSGGPAAGPCGNAHRGEAGSTESSFTTLPDRLYEALREAWPQPLRTDDLVATAGLPVGRVLAAVTRASVAGEVAETPHGVRLTRAPPHS